MIVSSMDFARSHLGSDDAIPRVKAVSTVTPRYPQTVLELPDFATDSSASVPAPDRAFQATRSRGARTRKPASGPTT